MYRISLLAKPPGPLQHGERKLGVFSHFTERHMQHDKRGQEEAQEWKLGEKWGPVGLILFPVCQAHTDTVVGKLSLTITPPPPPPPPSSLIIPPTLPPSPGLFPSWLCFFFLFLPSFTPSASLFILSPAAGCHSYSLPLHTPPLFLV